MWFRTRHLSCNVVASVCTDSIVSLRIALVKLAFENAEQA